MVWSVLQKVGSVSYDTDSSHSFFTSAVPYILPRHRERMCMAVVWCPFCSFVVSGVAYVWNSMKLGVGGTYGGSSIWLDEL